MIDGQQQVEDKTFTIDDVKIFLSNYYKQRGRLPTIKEAAERFGASEYRMVEIYRILVHEKFLRKNYSRYKMSDHLPPESGEDVAVPEVLPPPVPVPAPAAATSSMGVADAVVGVSWMLSVLRVVMTVIVLGAVSLSVYYTAVWLRDFLPAVLAVVLSSVMVTFSCTAFEIVILLWRGKQRTLSGIFTVLWAVVLLFSMVSTVAGQYNQRIHNQTAKTEQGAEVSYKRSAYESYRADEANLQEQLRGLMGQRTSLQNLLSQFDTLEKREADKSTFNDLSWRIAVVDVNLKKLNQELSRIRQEERKYLVSETQVGLTKETSVENPSFYVWIGSVLGVEALYVEFWLSVFPAVFIDLIAPFSLAFVLFIQKRKDEKTT